jgi:hypothetical protein
MGRGGKNNQHSGNEQLRDMARARADEYQAADKKGKSDISFDLVDQVTTIGGRFLKRKLVPLDLAREKASQCLRDAVATKKRQGSAKRKDSSVAIGEERIGPETTKDQLAGCGCNRRRMPGRRRGQDEDRRCHLGGLRHSKSSIGPPSRFGGAHLRHGTV